MNLSMALWRWRRRLGKSPVHISPRLSYGPREALIAGSMVLQWQKEFLMVRRKVKLIDLVITMHVSFQIIIHKFGSGGCSLYFTVGGSLHPVLIIMPKVGCLDVE